MHAAKIPHLPWVRTIGGSCGVGKTPSSNTLTRRVLRLEGVQSEKRTRYAELGERPGEKSPWPLRLHDLAFERNLTSQPRLNVYLVPLAKLESGKRARPVERIRIRERKQQMGSAAGWHMLRTQSAESFGVPLPALFIKDNRRRQLPSKRRYKISNNGRPSQP